MTQAKKNKEELVAIKLHPHNHEAEMCVLGAIIEEKHALAKCLPILPDSSMFYKPQHGMVYDACLDLKSKGDPIDLLTVSTYLRSKKQIDEIGGLSYLVELARSVSSSANLEAHAFYIKDTWVKRELISIGSEASRMSYDNTDSSVSIMEKLQHRILSTMSMVFVNKPKTLKSVLQKLFIETEQAIQNARDGKPTGLMMGLERVDSITGGLQKQDLVVLAGRPGMGKSALAAQIVVNAKIIEPLAVIPVFSLEMRDTKFVSRMVSSISNIKMSLMTKGNMTNEELSEMMNKCEVLNTDDIYIDDQGGQKILDVAAKCENIKLEKGRIDLIVFDFIQQAKGRGNTREQEVGSVSIDLKNVAKKLDCPVLAISSMNRESSKRGGDSRPSLTDLRDSGSIESDADLVFLLYRPEYYGIDKYEDGTETKNVCEVIIAKHKNGATDTVKVGYKPDISHFFNLDESPLIKSNIPEWNPSKFPQRDYTEPVNTEDDNTPF